MPCKGRALRMQSDAAMHASALSCACSHAAVARGLTPALRQCWQRGWQILVLVAVVWPSQVTRPTCAVRWICDATLAAALRTVRMCACEVRMCAWHGRL